MKLLWYLLMAWLSGCIALQAQSPAMLHFEVEDGLPGNLVYCAMEDHQGYVWFGTDKGLSRFDGQSFFNYGTKEGLPDPEVINLYQDAVGRLWIACFKQKPVYRFEGRFISAQEDTLLNQLMMKNAGYIFSETADSTLWIVSGGIISQKNGIQKQYPLKNIGAVAESQGDLLGLNGSQIFHISGKDQPLQTKSEAIWTHKKWASSYTQNGNRFLFAFPDLTLLLEYRDGQIVEVERTQSVFQTVYTDRLGRFWGASPGKGAVCFENDHKDLSHPVWYLSGKKISGVYHDLQGNFWFLSAGEGIFLRPNRQAWRWDKPSGLPSSNLLSLQIAHNGVLLAGDDLGNVHRISSGKLLGTQSFGGSDGTNFIRQILPLEPNTFWVISDEGFFSEHNTSHPTHWQSENGTISAGAPKSMASTGDRLWFGSSQGIASWEPSKEKMPKLLKKGRVTTIALDNEQQLWVGGIEGLFSNYQGFAFNWGDRFEALKQRIVALVPGKGTCLWAITPQSGLLELKVSSGQVQSLKVLNSGLNTPIKDVKKVFPAENGQLWLATNKGIFCVQPEGNITQFTMGHGLAGNEVNDLRVWKDTLWAATTNGLSLIDLKTIQSSRQVAARISHVKYQLGDSTVLQDLAGCVHSGRHQVVLPSEARQFSAWYVGLKANPGDIHAYRHIQRIGLLPFPWYTFHNLIQTAFSTPDTIWLEKPNYDFGHKLEANQYTIDTRVISLDGAESAEAAALTLTALPHWTETVWVWLVLMTLIAFLLGRFYRMRVRYLRVEAKMFQLKHQALKAQINPHFVGNSINAIQKFFYPPDPEKASEYIHLFTLLLRKTLSLSEVDFASFAEELAYNSDYLEMIQLRYGNQFSFQIIGAETIEPHLVFPTMILQPLLENATLHGLSETKKSELILSFWLEQDWCCCSVSDNGPGLKVSQARKNEPNSGRKSFGIQMLQDKTKVLNQLYPICLEIRWEDFSESNEGCGTTVYIRFKPLKHSPNAYP